MIVWATLLVTRERERRGSRFIEPPRSSTRYLPCSAWIVLCMTPVERQVRLIVLAMVGDRLGKRSFSGVTKRPVSSGECFRRRTIALRTIERYSAKAVYTKNLIVENKLSAHFFERKGRRETIQVHRAWNPSCGDHENIGRTSRPGSWLEGNTLL